MDRAAIRPSVMKYVLAAVAGILGVSTASFAYDSRFAVDPQVDVATLARTGEIPVRIEREGKKVRVDVSAVLKVELSKFNDVTMDFDHYISEGVPDLRDIKV